MSALTLFLLLSAFSTVTAQQKHSNISLGSSLSPIARPNSWLSPSGRFAFGFYKQGEAFTIAIWFAQIPQKTVIWTANQYRPIVSSNSTLLFRRNGGLILRSSQGEDKSITDVSESASSAAMLDSGNFVLYNSSSRIIWQSFDYPTNTIVPGQRLRTRRELFSSVSETDLSMGKFRLKMQQDGNLVQYPIQTADTAENSYWSSVTPGEGDNTTLNFDDNGHLYLLNNTGFNIKNLSDAVHPYNETMFYRATIDIDGIFRLYSYNLNHQTGNWSMEWNSSDNKCSPKGICGLNAFCIPVDKEPTCSCLPGFDYIDNVQQTLGCKMNNTSAKDCISEEVHVKHTIETLEKTRWNDDPYFVLSSVTEEECKEACLKDCTCEVVMFTDSFECRKQKLPLRFGRSIISETTKVLVKINSLVNNGDPSTPGKVAKEDNKDFQVEILIVSIVVFTFGFIVIGISGILYCRQRVWMYKRLVSTQVTNVGLSEGICLQSFTYAQLERATDGFKEELGRGSFGTVFKGNLGNNSDRQEIIAVKKLERMMDEGEREFKTEMRVIGRTHHRNLVRLLGYCHEGLNRLLVYEYMSNGSLANFLYSPIKCLNWDERVRIALNIAKGILYLHEECETQIIHCDIKPQNILMDEYHCAKISDFGLAKLLKPDQTRTFTGIRGTRGYVAPEWHQNKPVTVKVDVYSFGVVLLEILCCRMHLDMNLDEEEVVLVDWAYQCFEEGEMDKLVKDEEVDKKMLERMVRVALWCIQEEPSLRPSMKKVVLMLEGTINIPIPPSPTSFLSAI